MSPQLPSYEDAAALVFAYAAKLARLRPRAERVDLADATGRVLARALRADRDQPPFARSTRDGFACRAAEASAHRPLALAGITRAGQAPAGPLPRGAAWEVMTGAPVPAGADAVMMLEHVAVSGRPGAVPSTRPSAQTVRLLPPRTIAKGENVVARGAQARKGDELLPVGTEIGAAQVALAAACGHSTIEVFLRPRVAILATGDELVPVAASPAPGQIRNSNAPMLAAMVAAAGGAPWVLPVARDTAKALDAALAKAAQADLLLITGGVSAGKFDLVEPALARSGARFHFIGVRIQPGKPMVFGEMRRRSTGLAQNQNRTKCFGLPGNPVSSAVTFLLFAAPVIAALAGRLDRGPRFALARLTRDARAKPGLTRFLPAWCTFAGSLPEVEPRSLGGLGRHRRDGPRKLLSGRAGRGRATGESAWRKIARPEIFDHSGRNGPHFAFLRSPMAKPSKLSHFDAAGQAVMVNVGGKQDTPRTATASAFVELSGAVLAALPTNPKGNPLEVARFAGIQAAKRTADLIPMCHPLALAHVDVQAEIVASGVRITAAAATTGPTGVEMEALTAAAVAALTVYDMTKALDKAIVIREIRLESKTGGKSGSFARRAKQRS